MLFSTYRETVHFGQPSLFYNCLGNCKQKEDRLSIKRERVGPWLKSLEDKGETLCSMKEDPNLRLEGEAFFVRRGSFQPLKNF